MSVIVTQEVDSVPACAAAVIYIQQKETLEKQYWTFSIHKNTKHQRMFWVFCFQCWLHSSFTDTAVPIWPSFSYFCHVYMT